ncbi:MAG: hypothetical protein ACRD0V_18670 [Acidimicrobiales bacterium]
MTARDELVVSVLAAWGCDTARPGSELWDRATSAVAAVTDATARQQRSTWGPGETIPPPVREVFGPRGDPWSREIDDDGSPLGEWRPMWKVDEHTLLGAYGPVYRHAPDERDTPQGGIDDRPAYVAVLDALADAAAACRSVADQEGRTVTRKLATLARMRARRCDVAVAALRALADGEG